jgi:protoporphyrinogen oxidase
MARSFILGAGVTGLAAGRASGAPVYEARSTPGGICASYYVEPNTSERLAARPDNRPCYRFEIGGGHWIFGGDPAIKRFIATLVPLNTYRRRSAVYLPAQDCMVPYPIQNHLRHLDDAVAADAVADLVNASNEPAQTMDAWLRNSFGDTLCDLFFDDFHDLYTAGLWRDIAPQDPYKSPANVADVVRGAFASTDAVGYNTEYLYPEDGLDALMRALETQCDVRYGHRVVDIDVETKTVTFASGTTTDYDMLVSTLPLNRMMEMTGLEVPARPDPYTSVLVLNVGAVRGDNCPDAHWIYVPESRSGFHRVGFYSNVDDAFLPTGLGDAPDRVSIYVERAYEGGTTPNNVEAYAQSVVDELTDWGYIKQAEVVDPTWIDVAYTWSWPGSTWKQEALNALHEHDVLMVGRYARWVFQGIADSLRDGLFVGASLAPPRRVARTPDPAADAHA